MSTRRENFLTYYLSNGGNATEAAGRAGYKQPHVAGSRLLKHPAVIEQVRLSTAPSIRKNMITIERLTNMALGAHDRDDARAGDQLKAVEVIAKLHKLLENDQAKQAPVFNLTLQLTAPDAEVSRETITTTIDHEE